MGEEIERGSHGAELEGTEMGEERRALKVSESKESRYRRGDLYKSLGQL